MIIKKTKDLKIFNFIVKEYHINEELKRLKRKKFKRTFIEGSTVAKMLFLTMFIREKSFNQLEEKIHKRKKYRNIFRKNEKIPKMHGFREIIKELNKEEIKQINRNVIQKARENKTYRKGTIDNLVVVGIDGTEAFGSYKKKWENCYKTTIKVQEYQNNKKVEVEKEYYKQIDVFARIVGKRPGLILGYETVTCNGKEGKQEYEPDVAKKLIKELKKNYGRGIDVIVGDAIYLNDRFLKSVISEGYQAVIRLKDNNKKIIEDAEGLYKLQTPKRITSIKNKEIYSWSEILENKGIKIKVVKFKENYKKAKESKEDIIYVVSTDLNMAESTINKIIHARWDIENNGFNELKNQWNMNHCYMANEQAIHVILQMMILSYNLWELYIYGHLHNFNDMKITKIGYIEKVAEAINTASYKELIIFSSG